MKLSNEQLQFIDNYLMNSGIRYVDIRYEMADHVASALEGKDGDFHENFKAYMVTHKAGLLESNKKFSRIAVYKALRLVGVSMIRPAGLLFLAAYFSILMYLLQSVGEEKVIEGLKTFYLLSVIAAILYYKTGKDPKSKFSVIDKLLTTLLVVCYALFVIVRPQSLISSNTWLIIFYAVFTAFITATIFAYNKLNKKYKLRYNG